MVSAMQDKFYKITSDALLVAVELIHALRPIPETDESNAVIKLSSPPQNHINHILEIYRCVLNRLSIGDVDLEVKERAIDLLGLIITQAGDILPSQDLTKTIFPLLVDKLKNELTRQTTVRNLTFIANSILFDDPSKKSFVDLSPILEEVIQELMGFLRKAQRQLRLTTLICLEAIIRRYGSSLSPRIYPTLLEELKPLLSDSDLHIFPQAISCLCQILYSGGKNPQVESTVKDQIVPTIIQLMMDMPHLVAGGSGLESLLTFWGCIVRSYQGGSDCVRMLISKVESGTMPKQVSKQFILKN